MGCAVFQVLKPTLSFLVIRNLCPAILRQVSQTVGLLEGVKIWSSFLQSHFSKVFRHNRRAGFFACWWLCPRSGFWRSRFSAKGAWLKSPVFISASFAQNWGCEVAHFFAVRVAWAVGCLFRGRLACKVAFWQKGFSKLSRLACEQLQFRVVFDTSRSRPTLAAPDRLRRG